jgi:hypothetical protein
MSSTTVADYKMGEDSKTIRRLMKVITETDIGSNDPLYAGETAGDFAIRMVVVSLCKRSAKAKREMLRRQKQN